MIRPRSRLPLALILALVVGWVALWQWREGFRGAVKQAAVSPNSDSSQSGPDRFGPIPLAAAPDDMPAIPPRREVAEASAEMRELAARMSRDTGDLEVVTHADGRQSVSLEGRFMHMSAVVTGADGNPEVRCFSDFHQMVAGLPGNAPVDPPRPVIHAR